VTAHLATSANERLAWEDTVSMGRLSIALERPNTATVTAGASSFVRSTFCCVSRSGQGQVRTRDEARCPIEPSDSRLLHAKVGWHQKPPQKE